MRRNDLASVDSSDGDTVCDGRTCFSTVAEPAAPGNARMPDGKPNLTAPAPRTPDGKPNLSGIWHADGRYLDNLAGDGVEVPMHPWAAALYKAAHGHLGERQATVALLTARRAGCDVGVCHPFKIVQTPGELMVLFEEFNQ